MKSVLYKVKPEWPLRLGLGLTYLYSGQDIIRHPTAWYWALPYWLRQVITGVMPLNSYLIIQGSVEIVFALILIAWFVKLKVVALVATVSALEFFVILFLAFVPWNESNFIFTFRDIGLLGASVSLTTILNQKSPGVVGSASQVD